MKKIIPQKIKNIYHLLQAVLANIRFGFPSRKLKVIGVTGTDGKTTTTQMVTKILEEAGFGVAMASTINFKLGKEEWVNKTKFTTLSPWKVQEFIKKAMNDNCSYQKEFQNSLKNLAKTIANFDEETNFEKSLKSFKLDLEDTINQYNMLKKELIKNINIK